MDRLDSRRKGNTGSTRPLIDPRQILIEPFRGWQILNGGELWRFRELLLFLTWRDIRVRYQQTMIGAAWAIVQPLCMVAVFSLFLGRLSQTSTTDIPYPLFAFCGLVPWIFFSTSVNGSANSVLHSEKLVTKVYFPRILIPLAAIGSPMLDAMIASSLLLLAIALFAPEHLHVYCLLAPFCMLCIAMTAVGLGSALAALNVAYRDFKFILPLVMQLWLFATPSIYLDIRSPDFQQRVEATSTWASLALKLNPLVSQVAMFRECLLGTAPGWEPMLLSFTISSAIFIFGIGFFRWSEHRFADII